VVETFDQSGQVIGDRYRIIAPLGEGGMGITYEAKDLTNHQPVAIKALSLRQLTDWKALELFEREAKILATLNHPAIPKYLDYFQTDTSSDRRFYLVQELIAGQSLARLVQQGWHTNEAGVMFEREARVLKNLAHPAIPKYINSFEIDAPQEHRFCLVQELIQGESLGTLVQQGWQPRESQVKDIAVQILDILVYLHSLVPPVIHRDINPRNIIRQPNGKVFLVDFGAVQEIYRNTITQGGTFIGTLGYTALEQFRGQVKPASDLYSLGVTLLFLLTGQSPDSLPHQRMKLAFRDQVQISPEFANWLEQMLEPAIEDRFPSAQAARSALPKKPEYSNRLIPPRPSSSRIFLNKTPQFLLIHIPPGFAFTKVSILGIVLLGIFMFGLSMARAIYIAILDWPASSVRFFFYLLIVIGLIVSCFLYLG